MLMLQAEGSLQVVHVIASEHYMVGLHTAQASTKGMEQSKGKQCFCTQIAAGQDLE